MSPDERMGRVAVEVREELERIETVVEQLTDTVRSLAPGCPVGIRWGVGGLLHSFYTGCEMILSRLARAAGDMPKGDAWHRDLLIHSATPLEGVRPPVLSRHTTTLLDDLLKFRHFYRNAYGIELDVERLQRHAAAVPEAARLFRTDIEAFLRLLEAHS